MKVMEGYGKLYSNEIVPTVISGLFKQCVDCINCNCGRIPNTWLSSSYFCKINFVSWLVINEVVEVVMKCSSTKLLSLQVQAQQFLKQFGWMQIDKQCYCGTQSIDLGKLDKGCAAVVRFSKRLQNGREQQVGQHAAAFVGASYQMLEWMFDVNIS